MSGVPVPEPIPAKKKRLDTFEAIFQVAQMAFRRSIKGWRLFAALAVVVLPAGLSILIRHGGDAKAQERFFYGVLSNFHFGIAVPVVAFFFATAFPWPEADEGTLTYWFTSPVRRWHVLAGRYCASLVLGALILPLCVLAIGVPLAAGPEAELPLLMRSSITTTLLVYPAYLAMFQLVATVFRRGLAFGVVFILVENIISLFTGTIVKLTLVFYVRSMMGPVVPVASRNIAESEFRIAEPASNASSIAVFASVTLVSLGLSLLLVELIEYRGRTSQPG